MKIFSVKSLASFMSLAGLTLVALPVYAQTEEAGLQKVNFELQGFDDSQQLEAIVSPLAENLVEESLEKQAATTLEESSFEKQITNIPEKNLPSQARVEELIEEQETNISEEYFPQAIANKPVESQEWSPQITNSAALQPLQQEISNFDLASSFESDIPLLAQTDIELGRLTRSSFSYIGIGGNIGLTGETGVGEGAFVVNAKIAFSRNISLRPAAHFSDNTVFLASLTYDFYIPGRDPFEPVRFFPFVGGGIVLNTDDNSANSDNSDVGFLLTGGVDYPLSKEFTANATLNIGFLDETEVGIVLGVGYTFSSF